MSRPDQGNHSKAIHGGLDPAAHRGAVSVPIYQSSTFAFPSAEEGAARFAGTSAGPIYTRLGNPTVQALEECVADLEGGCGAIANATGMAAVSTVFLALLRTGDHVVGTHPVYGPSRGLLDKYFTRFEITSTFVPTGDLASLAAAIRPETRMRRASRSSSTTRSPARICSGRSISAQTSSCTQQRSLSTGIVTSWRAS